MNFLTQLFGGMTQVWLNVAFVVCVFTVVTFKPDRIRNLSMFRMGCTLFALSVIAPSLMLILGTASERTASGGGNPYGEITLILKIANLVAPLLFAGAFLSTIISMLPNSSDNYSTP